MPRGRPAKSSQSGAGAEPHPRAGVPDCPSYLGRVAKQKWKWLVEVMAAAELLTQADQDAMAMYCAAFERWRYAESQIKKRRGRLTVHGKSGAVQEPHVAISNRAMKQMNEMSRKLGLDPASRQKLRVATGPKPVDDAKAKFFKFREQA